jgi:hypothetical protein
MNSRDSYGEREAPLLHGIRSPETLIGQERVLGADHPDILATRNNLAAAYRVASRTAGAIESEPSDP